MTTILLLDDKPAGGWIATVRGEVLLHYFICRGSVNTKIFPTNAIYQALLNLKTCVAFSPNNEPLLNPWRDS